MIPKYLYHYTSVENFLLILKTGKIRFKRLDKVNDPIEGNIPEYPKIGRYVFTSSWTAQEREEIPMWKMYSDLKGVRFRMPIDLFNHSEKMANSRLSNSLDSQIIWKLDKEYLVETEKIARFARDKGNHYKINTVIGPSMVVYTDSIEDIKKDAILLKTLPKGKQLHSILIGTLGQRKVNFWSFEKEFRFRIRVDKLKITAKPERLKNSLDNILIEYIDICYKKESLEDVEILLGPKTKEEDEQQIIDALNEIGIIKFTINKSQIKIV